MIELVIKIPEEQYNTMKSDLYNTFPVEMRKWGLDAIRNGTPLPKGHGRIADMDEAIKCIKEVKSEDAVWAISLIEWACAKRTIIEADKNIDPDYEDILKKIKEAGESDD